jgi:hypothetical protein
MKTMFGRFASAAEDAAQGRNAASDRRRWRADVMERE